METTIIDKELYSQIDEFSYTIEDLKNVTYVLSECLIDSEFQRKHLAALAKLIHGRTATLTTAMANFMETLEFED